MLSKKKTPDQKGKVNPAQFVNNDWDKDKALIVAQALSERYDQTLKSNRLLRWLVFALLIALVCAVMAASAGWSREPENNYFYLTEDGVALRVDPVDQPNRAPKARRHFAERAFIELFDFDYLKTGDHFERVGREFLTPSGLNSLQKAMDEVGLIEEMKARKEILSLSVEGTPTQQDEGIHKSLGVYAWKYVMPIRLRLDGSDGKPRYKRAVAIFELIRVPPNEHVRGLLINHIQLLPPALAIKLLSKGNDK